MRQRKILIVHESKMIRNIIRNHLMAELEDVVTDFASSASEVFAKIQQTVFDVVICGNEMKEADGISICQAMHQGGINKDTPFMIITASPSPENLRKFAQSGIDSVISTPFTPVEIAEKVNAACNPRRWRKEDRIIVPNLQAAFSTSQGECTGNVVNISSGGMLCDLNYSDQFPNLLGIVQVRLLFHKAPLNPPELDIVVRGEVLRLGVLWRNESRLPGLIRAAWCFRDIPEATRNALKNAIGRSVEAIERAEGEIPQDLQDNVEL